MEIRDWLAEIGLDQFADAFEEEGIELDIIGDYTEEEFKQLGLKGGHCKRLLKAISALSDPSAEPQHQNEEAPLAALAQVLPSPVAFPLCEYLEEDHPGMKLWAACDTVELLLRLVVILSVAERQRAGTLDDKVLKQLQGKIEMPTLGAWMAMACSLAQSPASQDALLPELSNLVLGPLSSLLYGPDNPGTADTSFLALRNRLAHGGGLSRKEAERLLDIWQKPFEGMLAGLSWLDDVRLMGRSGANAVVLRGRSSTVFDEAREPVDVMAANPDRVWLVRGDDSLGLWPLIRFDAPVAPNARGETRTGDSDATQVYVRKDLMHLHLTPLGTDDFSHSEVGDDAIESFQKLFQLDKAKRDSAEKGFKVQGFSREIQRDAAQMVGRFEEQAHIESSFLNLEQGVVWLTGPAGIGKSYLVARMASDLTERFAASNTLIMPYRFRSGDDTRCNRDAFANYVIERLVAEGALIEGSNTEDKGKAEDRLKSCLNYLAPDKKLILVLDGLDEIATNDAAFAEEVPLALRYPRVVWVCAGRPEAALQEAFRINGATMPYPEGLPSMRKEDIRGMILEKIGPLRKKLLSGDKERGDEVMNPFIELVAERAAGLPLYVKYVIGDVLANRYRVLDGNEEVPDSLHAYHEQLIDRLGIGDLKAILTPLAAILAVAHEPLAEHELVTFMQLRKLITADDAGEKLIREGLAALAPMLRRAPDPEGEEGFTLFHASLRDHMLSTPAMTQGIATARAAFAEAALNPENYPNIANYLYRAGVDHLLELDEIEAARVRLLDLSVLQRMFALGKENQHILQYWLRIGDQNVADHYAKAAKAFVLPGLQESDLEFLRNVVDLCKFAGWYLAGSEVARESLVLHEQMLGGEHPDTLTSVNNLSDVLRGKGDYDSAEPLCRRALEARERTLGGEHPDTLGSVNNLGVLLSDKGDYDGAEPLYRRALEARERTLGGEHPDTLRSVDILGGLLFDKGDYDGAEPLYRRALEAKERTLGGEHPTTLASVNNLGGLLWAKGDYDGAEPLYRRALEAQERTLGGEHPDTLGSVNNLGVLLWAKGDYDGAEPLYRRALEARERTLGGEHPDTLTSVNNLGLLLQDKGDYDGTEPFYRRALEVRERTLGGEHPDTLESVNNLGVLLSNKGDYDGAEPLYRRALEARERTLGGEHPDTLGSVNNLGGLLWAKGDYDGAEPLYRRALEVRERTLGGEHPDTLGSVNNLGVLLSDKGDYDGAEPFYRRALEVRERTLGGEHPSTLTSVNNLGVLLSNKGDYDGAEPLYRRALEAKERTLGGEHPDTLTSVNNLSVLLSNKGDYEGAEPLIRRSLEARERTLGGEHVDTLNMAYTLGSLLSDMGDFDGAEQMFLKELKGMESLNGVDDAETLASVFSLGKFYVRKKEFDKAGKMFLRELNACEKKLGFENEETLGSAQNYGVFLREQLAKYKESEEYLRRVYEVRRQQAGDELCADLASAAVALCTTLGACDKDEEALVLLREGVEILRAIVEGGDEDAGESLSQVLSRLIATLEKLGKTDELAALRNEIAALATD